jgi:hypothetical protein
LYNLGLRWANGLAERSNVGSLAQLVEQRTFNPLVAGSNPARPTKRFKDLGETLGLFSFLVLQSKSSQPKPRFLEFIGALARRSFLRATFKHCSHFLQNAIHLCVHYPNAKGSLPKKSLVGQRRRATQTLAKNNKTSRIKLTVYKYSN